MCLRLATRFAWWCSPFGPLGSSSLEYMHEYYVDIRWFSVRWCGFYETRGARGNEAYDVLFLCSYVIAIVATVLLLPPLLRLTCSHPLAPACINHLPPRATHGCAWRSPRSFCHGVAEPMLLLIRVRVVRAQAADESQLLLAVLAPTPPLIVGIPIATLLEAECHPHRWRRSGGHFVCILTRRGRSCHANTLLILNELICEPSKELEAAYLLVVLVDHHLIEKEGVDAYHPEDAKVKPPVPMPGGEIAVQPQLVSADPVVHVDCSSTIVVFLDAFGCLTSRMTMSGGARPDLSS